MFQGGSDALKIESIHVYSPQGFVVVAPLPWWLMQPQDCQILFICMELVTVFQGGSGALKIEPIHVYSPQGFWQIGIKNLTAVLGVTEFVLHKKVSFCGGGILVSEHPYSTF